MRRISGEGGARRRGDEPEAAHPSEPLPDGEEAPPPGVSVMATVRWGLVALMALAALGAWTHYVTASTLGAQRAVAQYHCPMHPSVLADHPGACPICGMDLVPVIGAASGPATTALVPATSAAAKGAGSPGTTPAGAPGRFWCPMHPEVTSDDPDAICPKCGGMKLVPRPESEAPGSPSAAAVPGLAPIDLGAERVQLIGVRTAPVARERLSPTVRTLGTVTPVESGIALVTTRFAGWIDELRVSESGRFVRKGEVLARISSPELDALQTAYLNAVQWGRKDSAPDAGERGGALEKQTRDRMLRAGIADADLSEIARRGEVLRNLGVHAPVSGYVGKKSAVSGLYVTAGTELYEIVDLSRVWVVVDVYEPDIGRVKVGQPATITFPAQPQRTFAGRVEFLYPAVSPGTRTLQARIALSNPRLELRPGMYAEVSLDLGARDALVVPAEAVVDTGREQYVFVAAGGGRFSPRRVRLGTRGADKIELLEGPAEGERVVTTAQFFLDSESRLRATLAAPPDAAAAGPGDGGRGSP